MKNVEEDAVGARVFRNQRAAGILRSRVRRGALMSRVGTGVNAQPDMRGVRVVRCRHMVCGLHLTHAALPLAADFFSVFGVSVVARALWAGAPYPHFTTVAPPSVVRRCVTCCWRCHAFSAPPCEHDDSVHRKKTNKQNVKVFMHATNARPIT